MELGSIHRRPKEVPPDRHPPPAPAIHRACGRFQTVCKVIPDGVLGFANFNSFALKMLAMAFQITYGQEPEIEIKKSGGGIPRYVPSGKGSAPDGEAAN